MKYFFDKLIRPYILQNGCLELCEIGAFQGEHTDRLLAIERSKIALIDPCLEADLCHKYRACESVKMYRELSLNVLPGLKRSFDCFLIDGDHNWYTVFNELKTIEEKGLLKPGGVIFLHDVRWPYARRDMYYLPESIPEDFRKPYARKGMVRGRSELAETGGMNPHMFNATLEGGPRNGVLTAVEDFLKAYKGRYYFFRYDRGEGLGVLIKKDGLRSLGRAIEWFLKAKFRYYERKDKKQKKRKQEA